ncbi:hypothetical protein D5S18_24970 [Nocardia panacis]|uniref:Uncharacterized protein n=1 Tax=Nocardia panacis TaxID=2340916 RepID=A0A3A4K9A3_9NOCA|nr:hypothetical protein [Nocardia panacis]RJO71426.1 hypothetical protein D5S18_24970 [Nocardia panacis]
MSYREPTPREWHWHNTRCRGTGWLTPEHASQPAPCVVCKKHLRSGTATVYDCDPDTRTRR